ncbi:MAG: hypothetical protein A3E74_06210 [Omnitrophica bacterium RIFCSPHIGHO2_12_FULL_44_12]|nr:MAG: hypothetical protein A3E74_06210 [Omnitrophica bacterium RIFCSPHIGHO2_12_FULL_44_12]OGX02076.1 MAG: hypothetical protein A3J12_06340 [Omnitrophica bacterium RIFCSPLOWO2_02_FULL_44_11]
MNMEIQEKRAIYRHKVELPIKYRLKGDGKKEKSSDHIAIRRSITKDVTPEGLLLLSTEKFEPQTVLVLNIPTPGKEFLIDGRVVHVVQDPESGQYRTGIHFLNPDDAFKVKMAEQLLQILAFQKSLSLKESRQVSEEEAAQRWIVEHSESFAGFYQ